MKVRQVNTSGRDPIEALQRGAGRGLAAVLHARYPHLSFEIAVGPSEHDRWPSRAALDAEARRLEAVGDQPDALAHRREAATNSDHQGRVHTEL